MNNYQILFESRDKKDNEAILQALAEKAEDGILYVACDHARRMYWVTGHISSSDVKSLDGVTCVVSSAVDSSKELNHKFFASFYEGDRW